MLTEQMHPRVAELARKLAPLTENPPARPTRQDRNSLVIVREEIKSFRDSGIELVGTMSDDLAGLYVLATGLANQQEAFYEGNGNKWAT